MHQWGTKHSVGLFATVAAMLLIPAWLASALGVPQAGAARLWAWLATMLLLVLFILFAGQGITGVWRGALIDELNTMSLSRTQHVLWTVIVIAGYLAAALVNTVLGVPDPLAITMPGQLLIVLGISTTALIGTPLLRNPKESTEPDGDERDKTMSARAQLDGKDPATYDNKGQLIQKSNPRDANWADLFMGEETGNGAHLDVSRVQQFFFTIVLVIAYAAALGKALAAPGQGFASFPELDQSAVTILGISSAAYLAGKAIPRSLSKVENP